jgi:hypothetical protein
MRLLDLRVVRELFPPGNLGEVSVSAPDALGEFDISAGSSWERGVVTISFTRAAGASVGLAVTFRVRSATVFAVTGGAIVVDSPTILSQPGHRWVAQVWPKYGQHLLTRVVNH